MKKKTKLPFILRFIHWAFPKVEYVSPKIASEWAWKLFFTPFRFKPPIAEVEIAEKGDLFKINVENIEIQGYEWGTGDKTILVLHGWSGRATQFRKFIDPFNEVGYKVVAIDGPSHGRSSGKTTHIMEFVKVLKAVKLKFPEIDSIIAHSFGGAASMMAIREGLEIKRLINIGTPTDGDYIIADFLRRINGKPKSGELFKQKIIDMFHKPFSYFTIKESIKYMREDFELLVIHDKNDKEVPLQNALDISEHANTKLIITEGLGHMRILKDMSVINHCINFVRQEKKAEV